MKACRVDRVDRSILLVNIQLHNSIKDPVVKMYVYTVDLVWDTALTFSEFNCKQSTLPYLNYTSDNSINKI